MCAVMMDSGNTVGSDALGFLGGYKPPHMASSSVDKTVVFLVDVSMSMNEKKMRHCKTLMREFYNYHIREADDFGIHTFGSNIHKIMQIMPKHVVDLEAQLAKIDPANHVEDKRRLFDALSEAYETLAFRKACKGDRKEQFIILFTDYKGKATNLDGDIRITPEEVELQKKWLLETKDKNNDGIIDDEEMRLAIVEGLEEDSEPITVDGVSILPEQNLQFKIKAADNTYRKVNLATVHITEGEGRDGDSEWGLVNSMNTLYVMAQHEEHIEFFRMEQAMDKMSELWAESPFLAHKDVIMETFN